MSVNIGYQPPAVSWPYLVVIAVQLCIITYTWQFRKIPGAKAQVYCFGCKSLWLLFLVLAGEAATWPAKIFWLALMKSVALFTGYFWLLQIVELSNQEKMVPKALRHLYLALSSGLILVFLTTDYWYWRRVFQNGATVMVTPTPAGWLAWILGSIVSLMILGLSLRWIVTNVGLRRRQAIWYLMAGLISVTGSILNYFPAAQIIMPAATTFLLASLFMTWGFYRYQVYSLLTLAQELAWRNQNDGLLVIDNDDCIVALNPAAQDCLVGLPVAVGDTFTALATGWAALAEVVTADDWRIVESFRQIRGAHRDYQLQKTALTKAGRRLGKVLLIKDITQIKQNQAQLLRQQKVLSIMTERERLSRELHDGPGQIWNYWLLELQTLQTFMNEGQLERAGAEIRRLVGVANELDTNASDSGVGLQTAAAIGCDFTSRLQDYLAWYEKNYAIATRLVLPPELPELLFERGSALQLLRIIQEALTNTRKHARANQAQIVMEKRADRFCLVIADDGCGFEPAALPSERTSFGLQIMTERAAEIGGRLRIASQPGAGTRIELDFPLEKDEGQVLGKANQATTMGSDLLGN